MRSRVTYLKGSIKKLSVAAIYDLTGHMRPNEPLRTEEERVRAIVQNVPSVILHLSPEGRILEFNPEAERFYGWKREEVMGKDYLEIFLPEPVRDAVAAGIKKVLKGEPARGFENPVRLRDGSERLVAWNANPLLDPDGKPIGVIAVGQDITAIKKAEEERLAHLNFLEKLEEIDRAIRQADDLDKMMSGVLETALSVFGSDRAWLIYPCDPEASSWSVPMERTRAEYPGARVAGVELPTTPEVREAFQAALYSKGPVIYDPLSGRPLEEITKKFLVRSQIFTAIYPKLGKPWLFGMHQCSYARIWTERDVRLFKEIGRRVADSLSSLLFLRDLKKSEEKYRTIFEGSKDTILIRTPGGKILDVNTAGVELFGYSSKEELMQVNFYDLCCETVEVKRFKEAIEKAGFVKNFEWHFTKRDGQRVVANVTVNTVLDEKGEVVMYRAILRDITESKKLEQQLLQSQKMEAVGQLSSGIAHDFNNILTTIMGSCELLKSRIHEDELSDAFVDNILSAASEAANLTKSLLTFSRKQPVGLVPIDLNGLIAGFKRFLSSLIGEDIELKTELAAGPLVISADKGQMEQVLMNLATNARHAMAKGGRLTLSTGLVDLDDEFTRAHGNGRPGRYARLSVSDTGVGMDAETKKRMFEPFFTTREVGRGTGLGLSIVYGIVRQHNGYIDVYTEPGRGTEFRLFFPLIPLAEAKPEAAAATEATAGGSETVLLAEDNAQIRKLIKFALERSGYRVIEAVDGEDAVEKFKGNREEIRLLISDIVMPRKDGKEAYDELLKMNPSLKALFISGYAEEVIRGKVAPGEDFTLISKPFSFRYLLKRVREMLDREYAGTG